MIEVAILDYGTGNIKSISSALHSLKVNSYLAKSTKELEKADFLILPGVGHYGHAINNLKVNSLIEPIVDLIKSGLPTLGICLGFQLLTQSSEEALGKSGLGLLPLKTKRLSQKFPKIYKIPHIGWNSISFKQKDSILLKGIPKDSQIFYFCNSYGVKFSNEFNGDYAEYKHEDKMLGLAEYKNIFVVQFHPEKSHKQGLKLLHNFLFL